MRVREATAKDNDQLLALQITSPMGKDLVIQLDGSPDFFNRSRGYENWHVLVAEDEDKLLGAACYAVQEKTLGGEIHSMAYEYGFMVDPSARRMGVATTLQKSIEERNLDVDYFHLNITEDNVPSHSFFTRMGFKPIRSCAPYMLMAYKKHVVDQYKIRPVRAGDIPVVVELINETYSGYDFFTPYTPESFKAFVDRLPFLNLEDVYLYDHDTIKAVAGFWDYDKVMKFKMLGFNTRWRLMRMMTNFLGKFMDMPRMPGIGEDMTNGYLTPLGFRDPVAGEQLIAHILNVAYEKGVSMVSLPLDTESHVKEIFSKFRHGEGSFTWYIKPNGERQMPVLSNKPLFVDVIDV